MKGSTAPPAQGWARPLSSLRWRDYRWFWGGTLAAFMAVQMQMVARGWLAYQLTDSALALGVVTAAFGLPQLVFGPLGGVVADRLEKRKLLIGTQLLIAGSSLAIALLITLGLIQFWHLVINAVVIGTAFAFNMPSRQAIIPELVGEREVMNAVALGSVGMNISRVFAPALAGMLIPFVGLDGVYYLVTLAAVVAGATLFMINESPPIRRSSPLSLGADILEGLNYLRRHRSLLGLAAMALALVFFGMPYMMFMPVFARDILKVGPSGLGWLMTMIGVGGVVGSLLVAFLGDFKAKGLVQLGFALLSGVAVILFALSRSFPLSLALVGVTGAGLIGYLSLNNTLLMTQASPEFRGRVMSIIAITWGMQPLAALPAGAIAEVLGAPFMVGAGGALLILFVLGIALFSPSQRRLQ